MSLYEFPEPLEKTCPGLHEALLWWTELGPEQRSAVRMKGLVRSGRRLPLTLDELITVYAQEKSGVRIQWNGVGRNDPCPCHSGKKYKKCCL